MSPRVVSSRLTMVVIVLLAAACQDTESPIAPPEVDPTAQLSRGQAVQQQQMAEWFRRATPEVLALPNTVFADHDESANRLVFGVSNSNAIRGIETALSHMDIPATAYEVVVTEPIRFLETLRDSYRPTVGGIEINFSNYLCTLGFNVDHDGDRSFITNSHCTDNQGGNDGTAYYQPYGGSLIAFEVDDPAYKRSGDCPRGRKCRYSDAARALYQSDVESTRTIARTSGVNNGSLTRDGSFDITSQNDTDDRYSGTLDKVGRTTGWTQGSVTNTCATVNVSNSRITLICQTLVENPGTQIVGGGDSGSPVFRDLKSGNAELVGILWGGNSSGDLFVFSPLKNIQQELGPVTATTDGGGTTNNPPTADFTYTTNELTVDFKDQSTDSDGTIVSWDWDFGDSNTSTAQNPSHTYAGDGTYTVTLTVTDDGGATDNTSQSVTVSGGTTNDPPTAAFTYTTTDLTAYFTDQSTDSDGTIASWSWDFGDGNTSTAQNPSHTYAAGGSYTVTLTVTDDDGATDATSQSVTVSSSTEDITLSVIGSKYRGWKTADLTWSGATSENVDVYRDGANITTTENDGAYTDFRFARGGGTHTYQVCEAGSTTKCSNEATVNFN